MNEKVVSRNGENVIEVRSDGGRLLFIKTKKGYEIKCPRTKKICLVKYEHMLEDCFESLEVLRVCFKSMEDNFKRVDSFFKKGKSIDSQQD